MGNDTVAGLHGKTVALRALQEDDLEALRSFVNDPEVMRFSNAYRPIADIQQEAWFENAMMDADAVWFGIEDIRRDDGVLIGTCCLVGIDSVARLAELRIRIGDTKRWGHGLGSEACALLVDFGFAHLNLERIWLRVFASNKRALHLYEKLGFVVEGTLRRAAYIDGAWDDVVIMGLLRGEGSGGVAAPSRRRGSRR